MLEKIGKKLARHLSAPQGKIVQVATSSSENLLKSLKPCDVLLVEGSSVFSTAIKYLTQSNWSHAALCVGEKLSSTRDGKEPPRLVEADINEGVRSIQLSAYAPFHTRICRPVGLSQKDIDNVIDFAISRIGQQYDLHNIFDLARYLMPKPPVPVRFRRKLLSLGSGDPTRAICSSLIAQAFQSVRYPILPESIVQGSDDQSCIHCYREMLHIRHHSLFAPRDFDVSPYFQIVKPTLACGFDFHTLRWTDQEHE